MDVAKKRQTAKIGNILRGKAHVLQKVEGLLEPGGHQVIAASRKSAHEKFEGGAGVEAVLNVARRHGELVEVGEQPGEWSARKHVPEQIMPVGWKRQTRGFSTCRHRTLLPGLSNFARLPRSCERDVVERSGGQRRRRAMAHRQAYINSRRVKFAAACFSC